MPSVLDPSSLSPSSRAAILIVSCHCLSHVVIVVVCPLIIGFSVVLSRWFCCGGSPSVSSLHPPHLRRASESRRWVLAAIVVFASPSTPFPAPLSLLSAIVLFVVVLIHYPPHEQVLVVGVGVPSWRHLVVNNMDKTLKKHMKTLVS